MRKLISDGNEYCEDHVSDSDQELLLDTLIREDFCGTDIYTEAQKSGRGQAMEKQGERHVEQQVRRPHGHSTRGSFRNIRKKVSVTGAQ